MNILYSISKPVSKLSDWSRTVTQFSATNSGNAVFGLQPEYILERVVSSLSILSYSNHQREFPTGANRTSFPYSLTLHLISDGPSPLEFVCFI